MTTTKAPRTDAYRFTIYSYDDPRLEALKAEVKEENRKRSKDAPRLLRVSVKGRTGPRAQHPVGHEVSDAEWARMHTFGAVPKHLATYWDVYVHEYTRDTAEDRRARKDFWKNFEIRQADRDRQAAQEKADRETRLSYLAKCTAGELVAELSRRFPDY